MQVSDVGSVKLAVIEGRLDTETAPNVEGQLLALLGQAPVVLDMAGIRFVSSAGLRVLLKAAKAAKAAGTSFVLSGLQPAVQEVYDISGFTHIVAAHADRDAALAAIG
ncbi:MAG: STAS domain-containing protein [Azospirillaceae bacterium]|nr:STAS domain-containing protein [Azospirillaceae bacterium]